MLLACAIAVLSVLLGAAVGFSRRIGDRHLGPVRTFAFAAALAVVFGQFLPDAFEGIGIVAALPFGLGLVGPWLLERLTVKVSRKSRSLGLEIGYLGLLVHQLGDGVGMGTYTGPLHDGHHHVDMFLAMGGHTVPVAAMVVVAFLRTKGPRAALTRALGLALFVVLGVAAARYLSISLVERHHAFISALVGGLLVHIATDDLRANSPERPRDRALDLLAGVVGVGIVVAISSGHEHEHAHLAGGASAAAHTEALSALADIALRTAPMLLVGLVVSAVIHALLGGFFEASARGAVDAWLGRGSSITRGIKGIVMAVSLPGGSSRTRAFADALRTRGAPDASVVSFMLVGSVAGSETLLLTAQLLGVRASAIRIGAALGAALLGGMLLGAFGSARSTVKGSMTSSPLANAESEADPPGVRAARALDEIAHQTLPWMLVGLLAASYVSSALVHGSTTGLPPSVFDALALCVLACLSSASPVSATPLAFVLLTKGASPFVVLAGLVLGPAINPQSVTWLVRTYRWTGAMIAVLPLLVAAIAVGLAGPGLDLPSAPQVVQESAPGLVSYGAIALLGVIALGAIFRRGVRGFFVSLLERVDTGDGEDGHGDGHVHDGFDADLAARAAREVRLSAQSH